MIRLISVMNAIVGRTPNYIAALTLPTLLILGWIALGLSGLALAIAFRRIKGVLDRGVKEAKELAKQRESERDLAQQELFRRLYEEQELNKEKLQFQSQLSEYEKYAALARLALGAAHE